LHPLVLLGKRLQYQLACCSSTDQGDCLEHAEKCARDADAQTDPGLRDDFLQLGEALA